MFKVLHNSVCINKICCWTADFRTITYQFTQQEPIRKQDSRSSQADLLILIYIPKRATTVAHSYMCTSLCFGEGVSVFSGDTYCDINETDKVLLIVLGVVF